MGTGECVVSSRTEPLLINSKVAQPLGSVGREGVWESVHHTSFCCGTPCVMRAAPHGSYVMAQELSAKTVIEPHFHINSFHSGTAQNAVRKNRTYTKGNRILDYPLLLFVEKTWKQWRNQYGRVCGGARRCQCW